MQLVITTPGTSITQKDECFRLKNGENQADRSPLKVESIVISNKAMIRRRQVEAAMGPSGAELMLDLIRNMKKRGEDGKAILCTQPGRGA